MEFNLRNTSLILLALVCLTEPAAQAFRPERPLQMVDLNKYTLGVQLDLGEDLYPQVIQLDKQGKAAKAGLKLGDRIVSIDGSNAAFMGTDELRAALCRKEPATVAIEFLRPEDSLTKPSRKVKVPLTKAQELGDQGLASRLVDGKIYYPVNSRPLQAGFYPIDLPSFLRHEAAEGPLVLEFYNREDGPSKTVNAAIARQNGLHQNDDDFDCQSVSLISLSLDDEDSLPLRRHFRINGPSCVIVCTKEPYIKDYIDVVRRKIDVSELSLRLTEALSLREKSQNMMVLLNPAMSSRWREITNIELHAAKN